jgi:hypothetical protein
MVRLRNSEHHAKVHKKERYSPSEAKGDVVVLAGRSAYREDFERNYGPDLDEWLDATESRDAALAVTN